MFDDGARRSLDFTYQLPCCIRVNVIIERHLLAGKQLAVRDPEAFLKVHRRRKFEKRGELMRILSITQVADLLEF